MISVNDMQSFKEIANELLVVFDEDCKLYQSYPLLKRWQEVLRTIPEGDRQNQPWIVCDLPDSANQSYCIQTTHPTLADDSWRLEWMPYDITAADESEIKSHLKRVFGAWLRAVGRQEAMPPANVRVIASEIQTVIVSVGHKKPDKKTLRDIIGDPTSKRGRQRDEWEWPKVYARLCGRYTNIPSDPKITRE